MAWGSKARRIKALEKELRIGQVISGDRTREIEALRRANEALRAQLNLALNVVDEQTAIIAEFRCPTCDGEVAT